MAYNEGKSYSGFVLQKKQSLGEIDSEVFLFRHQKLKFPLLAIKNEDPNKTFAAAFNTIPTDSTGVAHILEHSVLMGSQKYPVKDVFGEINKGGLTTFLNAMTGADVTYYPFATRNLAEYFNVMDVYCDVVFNPLLASSTFEQEGWHYHQEDKEGPLTFQGVVYNEMKGAFSDPIRHLFHHIFAGLMPNSTYAHESGGDPRIIPELSYQQFCDFHKRHYHPSNSMLFLYGDAPLERELEFLESRFFKAYEDATEPVAIKEGELAAEPVFLSKTYAVESDDIAEKTFLAVGTSVATATEREKNTAFQIIANILYNSDGSPLKNAIVSSGLCKDFGGLFLSTSAHRTLMLTYLVGSEEEHRDQFLELYRSTLKEMVEKGLEKDLIIAELNKFEFGFREEAAKAQRGLDLLGKAMAALKYGADPFAFLCGEELIASLRQKALGEGYFEGLIAKYLLDNPATVVVSLKPDPQKQLENQQEEQGQLEAFTEKANAKERQQIIDRTKELIKEQLRPNDEKRLALLPKISVKDLPTDIQFHSVTPTTMFGQQVLVNELQTNHISYLDIGFDIASLTAKQLSLLDLFATIVTEIGTSNLDFQQFAKEVATCAGSFSHSITSYTQKNGDGSTRPVLWFHLKCLPDYIDRAIAMLAEVFSFVSFANRKRIQEIVGREFAWSEHAVQSEGYSLPATRAFAHLSPAGHYNELVSGVSAYLAVKGLAMNYQSQEETFLKTLSEIKTSLFSKKNLLFAVTAETRELGQLERAGQTIIDSLGTLAPGPQQLAAVDFAQHEAFITSAEIVFAVQGGNLLPGGKGYNGHFEVLKTYLSRDYLWNTVRQLGGAYGCFIQFGQISGNLALVSYRDPQVKKTYDTYGAIPEVVGNLQLTPQALEQIIVGTYGNFDPLQSAATKGAAARNDFLNGITPEFKRQRIEEIVTTKIEDLQGFAPAFASMQESCHRKIIGNRGKIEADGVLFDSLLEL